jgi:hypothetical protein
MENVCKAIYMLFLLVKKLLDEVIMTLVPVAALTASLTLARFSTPGAIEFESLLDLAGLAVAIWTLWSSLWLHLGGHLQRAFQLISLGALAFASSHLLDSILEMLGLDSALLIHQGAVITSMLFFVSGLANLADALPALNGKQNNDSPRLWPLSVGLVIAIGAISFILFGLGPLSETLAFISLEGCLILLSIICLGLVTRARLGGSVGRSLWQAVLGLLLFSLAHPVQVWFYEETSYAPELLGILHRLIVIPAFFFFAVSITGVARGLKPLASS